jgi:peptidoglycan/LPS O-acetylase OafA/YrhL
MKRTFGSIMQEHRGIGPGFDFVRLALAFSVVVFHCFQVSYGRTWSAGSFAPVVMLIVPAFFALSGFLVAGSMIRNNNIRNFLLFRGLRILPALVAEVTLSALVLGPLVTALPVSSYFTDPMFARYFTNVVGIMRYTLPGVFLDNPLAGIVNGQLWTVPSELRCYSILGVAMILRIATRRRLMLGIFLVLSVAECLTALKPGHHYTARVLNSEEMLVLSFLCGNIFYLWKDQIPSGVAMFATSIVTYAVVTLWVPALSFILGSVAATYFVVYLGMLRIPRVPVLMAGDYSYGIYLYSFPIQQALIWRFPDERAWYFNLLTSAPLTIVFAAGSWHLLEKPVLSLRKRLAPQAVLRKQADAPATDAASGGAEPFGAAAIADP